MKTFILGMLLCIAFQFVHAQTQNQNHHQNLSVTVDEGPVVVLKEPAGIKKLKSNGIQAAPADNRNQKYIIQFKEAPFLIEKKNKRQTSNQNYTARFTRFLQDANKLKREKKLKDEPKIKKEFHKIFFGAEVEMTPELAKALRQLDYVKRVSEVVKVEAILDQSTSIVNADQVWSQYGNKGEGVTIGIIDTGIDYNHPALGGGFGSTYKVIGGYDFVNHDNDPMDDHGHGTHCAGIVSADGSTVQGVAPKANLVALKVLSAAGWGYNSDIIAAIEWAADPDQNGDDSDKLDILSLSLGGAGDPDDPTSAAVDHAVSLGIVVCVAAGNSYDNFKISSPGTARNGITVGASNNNGGIASFSSKGPNTKIFSIKPEVVAPGVDINSTFLNGTLTSLSGTSMATPHVAGVAALLRSLHPHWTTDQIKSALMTTATDLGTEATTQGAGQINAIKAAGIKTFVHPAHASFGMMSGAGVQVKYDTLIVFNADTFPKSYTANATGGVNGLDIRFAPTSFTVGPGASQELVVSAAADHNVLPIPDRASGTYSGRLKLTSASDTLSLPWAVVKSGRLLFTFDAPYPNVWVSCSKGVMSNISFKDNGYAGEFFMSPGEVDIVYMGGFKTLVFRENVLLTGNDSIHISESDATHTVKLQAMDENGQPLVGASQFFRIDLPSRTSSRSSILALFISHNEFKVSSFSPRFELATGHRRDYVVNAQTIHSIQHPTLKGLQQSVTFTNNPSEYISQDIEIFPHVGTAFKLGVGTSFTDDERFSSGLYYFTGNFTGSWKGKLYQSKTDPFADQIAVGLWAVPMDYPLENQNRFLSTPLFIASGDGISASNTSPVRPFSYISPSGNTMTFGKGVFYPNGPSTSRITELEFYGKLNESLHFERSNATYKLFTESGAVSDSGSVTSLNASKLLPGKNHLEVKLTPSRPENTPGTGTYTAKFDHANGDHTSLFLHSFQILNSKGVPSDTLERGEYNALRFSMAAGFRETHLYVKAHTAQTWQELKITKLAEETSGYSAYGYLYEANLVSFNTLGPLDVKVAGITRTGGNQMEWKLERAFVLEDLLHPALAVTAGATNITEGSQYDLGGVNIGHSTSPVTFTIQSTGIHPINLPRTPIIRLSSGSSAFTVNASTTARDLQPGETTTFTVNFTASRPGIVTDTLWIASNADMHNPFRIILKGNSLGPEMQLRITNTSLSSGSSFDYGSVVVGSIYVRTITIDNTGSSVLNLSGTPKVQITGDGSFTVNQQNLSAAINNGASSTFTLQFKPLTPGNKTATVTIINNDSDENPYTFIVSGKGVTGDINLKYGGTDLAQNTNLIVGTTLPGQSSSAHTFTIENLGDHPLFFSTNKISVSGTNTSDFIVNQNSIPQSLPAGSTTSFTVTFAPQTGNGGNRTAELSINSNDYDESSFKFKLQGIVPSPEAAISYYTTSLASGSTRTFGTAHVGYTGTNFRFTLENKGAADLLLNQAKRIHISGPDSLDYILDQSAVPATLAPGASVYFYISFKPTTHGTRRAKLVMTNNDLDENPYTLNLSGEGLFPDLDIQQGGVSLPSGTGTYDFGSVAVGTSSSAVTFYIANVGYTPLTFYSSPIVSKNSGNTAEFTIVQSSVPSILQPGASAPFTITFNPTSLGTKNLALRINSSDVDEYSYIFTVKGTSVTAGSSGRLKWESEKDANQNTLVTESASDALRVFPNPSKTSFTVYISDPDQTTRKLKVFSPIGVQLSDLELMTNTSYTIGENWAPGIYFIESIGKAREVVKIIKE